MAEAFAAMNEESWLPEIAALPLTGTQFTGFTNTKVPILTQNGRAAADRSGLRHQLDLLYIISCFTGTKVHILTRQQPRCRGQEQTASSACVLVQK